MITLFGEAKALITAARGRPLLWITKEPKARQGDKRGTAI
jgi:hypothetical protein